MMQFNLLPDVKLEYVRTRRTQRIVITFASLITIAAVSVFVFMLVVVNVIQKKNLNDLTKDINSSKTELENIPDLNKILTVQNQLVSLPALNDKKPETTRLFEYIKQITPSGVQISQLQVDFVNHSFNVVGTADALGAVNTFADTLKFTEYQIGTDTDSRAKAFSSVVLSTFGRSEKNASFTIVFNYEPVIFDTTQKTTITVPKVDRVNALFKAQTQQPATNNGTNQ